MYSVDQSYELAMARAFSELTGQPMAHQSPANTGPKAMGPTILVLEDPQEDIDEILDRIDSADPFERRISRRLKQNRDRGPFVGQDESGQMTFNGRTCCLELILDLDKRLHLLPGYSEHTCPGCGTRYAVATRVREERGHGTRSA